MSVLYVSLVGAIVKVPKTISKKNSHHIGTNIIGKVSDKIERV
jgi:hypothetical protein